MGFSYTDIDAAIAASGLRMVVVGNVPSPWGEAAKGIFHVKGLDWLAVRLDYASEAMKDWTGGQRSGPVAVYNNERPRSSWVEILMLAERLAPAPALLPADATQRALVIGLSHELCGEEGLAWSRRLQLVQAGLSGSGGFEGRVAKYLSRKYGYLPEAGEAYGPRVASLLGMLAERLLAQKAAGSDYYVGDALTAVDIYSAAVMALFNPLPQAQCAMEAGSRTAFETLDEATRAALAPLLLEHRDMMYARHLQLPLAL